MSKAVITATWKLERTFLSLKTAKADIFLPVADIGAWVAMRTSMDFCNNVDAPSIPEYSHWCN